MGNRVTKKIQVTKKWIQVANLYPKMKRADQERLQSRMNEWAKLSQKDRRIARDNYLSSLRFPAEQKASAWQAYQQLSPEDKKKLAAKEDNKKKPTAASSPTLWPRRISGSMPQLRQSCASAYSTTNSAGSTPKRNTKSIPSYAGRKRWNSTRFWHPRKRHLPSR